MVRPAAAVPVGAGSDRAVPPAAGTVGAVFHRLALRLSGEQVNFRPSIERAEDVVTASGWTPERTSTGPELIRHYLAGTGLPTSGVRPTAFALTARRDGP
jgi:hypothetical protein